MTAGDAANREPTAAQRSVFFERFDGVRGAAWIIAARRRQQRRQRHLIPADEQDQDGAHNENLRADSAAGDSGDSRVDGLHVKSKHVHRCGISFPPCADRNVN
jgi:hypothetical protein